MEIIYRLCEHNDKVDEDKFYCNNYIILDQEVMLCNSKEEFKEIIKSMYGDDIKFKHTSNMKDGDLFISIISYNCYNSSDYVCVQDYVCSYCGKSFKNNKYLLRKFDNYWDLNSICKSLYESEKNLLEKEVYCCRECQTKRSKNLIERYKNYVRENNLLEDNF